MVDQGKMSFPYFSEEEYHASFAAFLEGSPKEREQMLSLSKHIIAGFNQNKINMLSIGAGTGCFEDSMIEKCGLSLEYFYGIEPNENQAKQLENTVSKWKVKYTIDKSCFTPEFECEKKFDLIIMSHSLYYMPNPTEAIMTAKSLLRPNGKLLVFHNTEDGAQYGIVNKFLSLASLDTAVVCNHGLSLEEISRNLTNKGIQNYIRKAPVFWDVGKFIAKQNSGIISFILQTCYENFPLSIQKEIYQVVKDKCVNPEEGKCFIPNPAGVLVTE